MKITIVGTGYVGLVTGTCFAEMGMDVTCVDVDAGKVEMLRSGRSPVYEPGLEPMMLRNMAGGRLRFTTSLPECLDDMDIVFNAVGTPPGEDGAADMRCVLEVARTIGRHINKYVIVVTKSTVPVGTALRVKDVIRAELDKRGVDVPFDVASNPEFLKEGDAVSDFMSPDRIVVGVDSDRAKTVIERLYKPFMMNNYRLIFTDIPSAEMIKYAANAMLATRISFMNDIANLCGIVGADVDMVRKGIGADGRIGNRFLYAGIGYGGSCFPKDMRALIKTAADKGYDMAVLRAVEEVNARQKRVLFDKLSAHFGGELDGRVVAMWGLSFKPETDDMREASSLVLIDMLLGAGCRVRVHDPVSMGEARRRVGDRVEYADSMYDAAEGADALMLVTEWKQFRVPGWDDLRSRMRQPVIFDGRNIYDRAEVEEKGFAYYRIG